MKKECSIRILLLGIILSSVLGLGIGGSAGFFAGTQKSWSAYEQRIALLQEENSQLLAAKAEQETEVKESLNVVEPYEYVLLEENGYVAVYHTDRKTLYASTDILVEELPQNLQEEIKNGKFISSEAQLYNFLESYTS